MAKKSKASSKTKSRSRKRTQEKRQQQKQRNQTLIFGGVAVVVIAIVGFFLLSQSSNTLEYNERFDLDPIQGDKNAPVTIIEYGAYACPACKSWHEAGVIEQILAEFPGQVRFIFRDMPVISPSYDRMAAELADCVLDQHEELYWRFHHALYTEAQQSVSSREDLVTMAGSLGVDTDALNTCYDNGTHQQTVLYDYQRGQDLGIRGTPTFFVNGQRMLNASPDALRQMILQQL